MAINHGLARSPPINKASVQRTTSFRENLRVNNAYAAIPGAITASPMRPFVRIAKATEADMTATQIQRCLASIAVCCSQNERMNRLINGTSATSCAGDWVKIAGSTSVSDASVAYMTDSASNIRQASNAVVAHPKSANRTPWQPNGCFIHSEDSQRHGLGCRIKNRLVAKRHTQISRNDVIAALDHFLRDGRVDTFVWIHQRRLKRKGIHVNPDDARNDRDQQQRSRPPIHSRRPQIAVR